LLLRVELFFENLTLREHDAVALVVEVDDLEAQAFADEFVEVADRLAPDLRRGDEATHAEVDEDAALDDLSNRRFDDFVVIVRGDDFFPRLERPGAAFTQEERTVLVVDPVDHDLKRVADLELFGVDGKAEFAEGQRALGFAADVDEQFVLILRDDDAGEHLAFVENFQALFVQALLERELIFFFGFDCRRWRSDSASN
jgi:hypothetical protein